jgi:hypothetical protein
VRSPGTEGHIFFIFFSKISSVFFNFHPKMNFELSGNPEDRTRPINAENDSDSDDMITTEVFYPHNSIMK